MRALPLLLVILAGCPSASRDANRSQLTVDHSAQAPKSSALATADAPQAAQHTGCADGMVLIQPATFTMGTTPDDPNDAAHQVTLTKPYCIDRTPVTVAEYRRCVEAKACTEPRKQLDYNYGRPGRDAHPVNAVTWAQADTYCKWADKRLPTEAEWELAARGTDGRKYPWGNEEPDDTRLWWSRTEEREGTSPVGSHPAGASPYGVQDMLGNVSQWVADYGGSFTASAQTDPLGPPHGESKVERGAAYDTKLGELHVGERFVVDPAVSSSSTGTRCARSAH